MDAIEQAVRTAIEADREWQIRSTPSATPVPRVAVSDGGKVYMRRPFRRRGAWCVRLAGTARLTNPHVADGMTVFDANWS